MASSVGGIYAELGLNAGEFHSGLRSASRELQQFGAKAQGTAGTLSTAFSGLGKGLTLALGAAGIGALGLAELQAQVRRVVAEVSDLAAQARMAGVGVEVFQELRYAAMQAHVGLEALTDGMKELQLRADEFATTGKGSAAEAFQRIGISAADLKTKLKDPVALLDEVMERIRDLNTAARIRVLDELFGGTAGEQFIRFLELGRNGIARMRDTARETGSVIGEDWVREAEEVDRKFKELANTVDTTLKKAVLRLIDALRGFGNAVVESLKVVADTPQAALAKTASEVAGIRAQMDQLRATDNRAAVADLDKKLKDAEKRYAVLAEAVREYYRGGALTELTTRPAPGSSAPMSGAPLPPPRPAGLAGGGVDVAAMEAAAKAAQELAKAYTAIKDSARDKIADAKIELATMGMTTEAAAAYRFEQEMINQAAREHIQLTPRQKDELAGLSQQYAQVEEAIKKARDAQEQMNELRQMASGFFSDLRSGLKEGKSLADSFSNAVGNLTEKLLDMLQNKLLMDLFKMLSGPGSGGRVDISGGASSIGLFARGGPVRLAGGGGPLRGPGTGTSDSIPALLSNGEYVVRASQAKKYGALLEAINSGRHALPRFASGGGVGMPALARGGVAGAAPIINITNNTGANVQASARQEGGRWVINQMIEGAVNKALVSGKLDAAMRGRFGMGPKLNRMG